MRRHLSTFLERVSEAPGELEFPSHVRGELERYLRCGLLSEGFVRVYCPTCKDDLLVAFSCKGRGVCPSCTGRRMADTAARWVDRVLPEVSWRQRVFVEDVLRCRGCGGPRRLLAEVTHPDAVLAILTHLGIDPKTEGSAGVRGPPSRTLRTAS